MDKSLSNSPDATVHEEMPYVEAWEFARAGASTSESANRPLDGATTQARKSGWGNPRSQRKLANGIGTVSRDSTHDKDVVVRGSTGHSGAGRGPTGRADC